MQKRTIVAALAIAGALIAATTTGAVAAGLITSAQIQDGTIRGKDLNTNLTDRLDNSGEQGPAGADGIDGTDGTNGKDNLLDAYYATGFYNAGNTNAGAIATVACKNTTDVAISGGVQVLGIGDTKEQIDAANARNTPVSSSFPGRMDWANNAPKVDRLDGWIVQFGGNAGATSDKAPEKAKVWALCVPGATIMMQQTYSEQ